MQKRRQVYLKHWSPDQAKKNTYTHTHKDKKGEKKKKRRRQKGRSDCAWVYNVHWSYEVKAAED